MSIRTRSLVLTLGLGAAPAAQCDNVRTQSFDVLDLGSDNRPSFVCKPPANGTANLVDSGVPIDCGQPPAPRDPSY